MAKSGKKRGVHTISVEEFADVFGISRASVYNAVIRGEIPVIRFGKLIRIPRAAVNAMLRGEPWPAPRGAEDKAA